MFLKALSSCLLHAFRGRESTASWETCSLHYSSSEEHSSYIQLSFPFLQPLPLGFPVPPSGKGLFCPITSLLWRSAADSFSASFPSASSGTFPQSCSPILFWWIALLGHECKNVDLSSLNFMKCLSTIPAAWPGPPEQRLCSLKHQLQFHQVHVICRHSEGAIPLLHPGCIIHPCVMLLLCCSAVLCVWTCSSPFPVRIADGNAVPFI